tara:strand:- start:53 stop:418 length:366 start_codon:yes stop_codon:yes gene_type:complete
LNVTAVFYDKSVAAISALDRPLLVYQKTAQDDVTAGPDPLDRIRRHVDQRDCQDIGHYQVALPPKTPISPWITRNATYCELSRYPVPPRIFPRCFHRVNININGQDRNPRPKPNRSDRQYP